MKTALRSRDTSTALWDQYSSVRTYTEELCRPLQIEDYIPQPVAYVSPPKWHLAHSSWFFETFLLKPHLADYLLFDADFSYLFNSYYNAVGDRVLRADRGNITRPGVDEVYRYRSYVDRHMKDLISTMSSEDVRSLVILGVQHEQQHQELLITDLKYILGHNPVFPIYQDGFTWANDTHSSDEGFLTLDEGVYEIGFAGDGFHFDNELGRHKYYLHSCDIARSLVTNGEYLAFIEDGGYDESSLWLDEGWNWLQTNRHHSPLYWHQLDGQWHQYTLSGLKTIYPQAVLCHINFFEAAAFAEWAGYRLPTEFEWEAASDFLDWGLRWEWTHSAYLPYPGFDKAPGALGEYNGKFMINQMVLRGASSATSPGHSRKTYRNFFHPHLGWQCTGIRLARKR